MLSGKAHETLSCDVEMKRVDADRSGHLKVLCHWMMSRLASKNAMERKERIHQVRVGKFRPLIERQRNVKIRFALAKWPDLRELATSRRHFQTCCR